MKFINAVFWGLSVFVLVGFAQTAENQNKPEANKIAEFEMATDGYVKMMMDSYFIELSNNPASQGYIINYGLLRDLARRRTQFLKSIKFRNYDATRMTFVDSGFRPKIKSELWIVPPGAENPTPQIDTEMVDEFEKVTPGDIKARIDNIYIELNNKKDFQGYILNFGTKQQIAARVAQIKKYIFFRKFDSSRITFIDGGTSKTIKTQFWIDKKTP